jgi:predicted enzyme related to lactoylglutathione lyase
MCAASVADRGLPLLPLSCITICATHAVERFGPRRTSLIAAQLANITFDCDDVMKVAGFWSAALGRQLDRTSSELFASIGKSDGDRAEPAWYFTKVPEPKQAKNRVHVDLTTPDPAAVDELVALGATVVGDHEVPGGSHRWTVMQDPEGNEFCVAAKSFTGWS